jgi:uncharacterized membrane protein (DUF2068 family)
MNRTRNIQVAAILTALYCLVTILRASIAIATQSQAVQEAGNGFAALFLILCTAGLVSAYGIWNNQKWGKILAIISMGLNGLLSLPGVVFAPTLWLKMDPGVTVLLVVIVIVLLLRRPRVATAG